MPQYSFGAIPARHDPRDARYAFAVLATQRGLIGQATPVKLYPEWLAPIRDQGPYGMCVAYALTTLMEYLQHRESLTHSETVVPESGYSQGWIYGNRLASDYQGEGMDTREALATLVRDGVPFKTDLPYVGEYPNCSKVVGLTKISLWQKARYNCPKTYSAIAWAYPEEVKAALVQFGALAVTIAIYEPFMAYGSPAETSFDSMSPFLNPTGTILGYHEMVMIGYNERGVIVQNSWGTGWGAGPGRGYVLIPWNSNIVQEVWALTDWTPQPQISIEVNAQGNPADWEIFSVGSDTMWVDNRPVPLDVPAMMIRRRGSIDSRSVVPLRAPFEAMGYPVSWDADRGVATVTPPVPK
jgi:hypothetical protein